jgi:PAS domain S-box-containing protein
MKTNHQIIKLFPIPTFLIAKNNFGIICSNNKGCILTQLNEDSIKKHKITNFIDKNFLKIGESENCCFNINEKTSLTGNLTVQSFNKDNLIVSFWSNIKTNHNSNNQYTADKAKNDFQITKSLLDLSTDSIFIMRDEIIHYVNRNLLQISGYKLTELIGLKFTKFVYPKELEKVYSLFTNREKGKSTRTKYESIAKHRNGKCIDVEVEIVNIIFEGLPSYQVVLKNITKRKIAERKYQNIIDFAPIGFYQTSKNGDFILVNNEFENILGFENNETLITRNISEFYYSTEEREKIIKKYDTATKSEAKNIEIKFKKKDGSPIWILMTARAIKDKNQNTLSYDGFIIDISNRKKKEKIQKILLNLSKKSFANIGLKEYLELIHNELKQIMKADNFYVALYDKTTDKYSLPYYLDLFENYDSYSSVHLNNTLTDLVRKLKKGLFVTEAIEKKIHEKYQISVSGKPSPIWLGVPLIDSSNDEAIGVLALKDYKDEKAYDKEDFNTLEIIASNLGLFIERVKNQENLRLAKIAAEEGENKYKSLFYDNNSVILLVDPFTGNIVDANKSACDYYGYSYQQLTALKIQQINTLSDKKVKEEMQKSLNKISKHFNFKHQLASGEIRDVEVYSGNVNVAGNKLLYSIVHDITKRKVAEEKVLKLTTSIEQSPISVIITDLEGVIEYVNPYYSELTGYDIKELLGNNPRIVSSNMQSKQFYKELWDTILVGNKWQGEFCNKKKNGEHFWERAIISPIKNKNGIITNFVSIKEDITERKKMIDELIFAKEKAEESDRLKSAFLANMSHEIRTPMNGILGFTSLLLEPELSDETKENYVQIIHQSGERMLNTVTDIIEISKIEAGITEVKNSIINLNEVLNSILNFFKPQAQEKGLILNSKISAQKSDFTIFTDKGKFESIFTNLIKNAIKYSDKGEISVRYIINNEFIEFCVDDDGIGVPENRQSAIFNRFEQADIEDTRVFEGSGLGLAIAKSYVEMLGGKIWVESVEGKGSQFYFSIPFLPVVKETTFTSKIVPTNNKLKRLSQINILIVEDDDASATFLKIILKNITHKIIHAQTGEQAIEECKTNVDFDIILMDIKMPGIDGFETTKRIREFNKKIIIIAQTAYAMLGDKEKAISSGCNDYITKPIKKNEILNKIEENIKKSI